jgi:hypothetical protein
MKKHIINNFIHRIGYHCESSAMRDLFEFHGFPMTEAMAFGLDATLGFGFFDTSNNVSFISESNIPFFLGGKQGTIDANSLACRILGITLRKQSFTSADKAWEESKSLINQDIPLILQMDLGYLPYFEDEGNIHFGGHTITLAGYDENKGITYIGDSQYEGFKEVTIELLKKGRSSVYGPKFMRPNNTQFSMQIRSDGKHPPLAAGIKLAIQKVVNNMLRPSMNNNGIHGIKLFARTIPEWRKKLKGETIDPLGEKISRATLIFQLIHGYIETWGTGGASFRNLYKDFLKELLEHPELKTGPKAWSNFELHILEECLPIISSSAQNWTQIAMILKESAEKYKSQCLDYVDLNELQNIALNIFQQEELLFTKLSKIKI